MRTTLDLDEALAKAAEKRAAEEGRSLTSVIEEALRRFLHPSARTGKPFKLRLLTMKGRVVPGVDYANRDSLCDRMDGRS